jgi:hypothetical protein
MRSVTDGSGWSRRRAPIRNGVDIEPARTTSPKVIDTEALAEFNRGIDNAKRSYYGRGYYEQRTAASEASQRLRARKKGKA